MNRLSKEELEQLRIEISKVFCENEVDSIFNHILALEVENDMNAFYKSEWEHAKEERDTLKKENENFKTREPYLAMSEANLALCKERDQLRARVESLKESSKRDGNWIDKWGACKVCDGEIPHGHTENCDIYKLEKEIRELKEQLEKKGQTE